ncbi:MAG: 50S ribosomal protein L9 [Gammaproteobacteria bacterium]|nr:50S ribosomal protein L9 [Gammaproteobacteria bacterium]
MEVILLEKVDRLGTLGDKVNVKSGFARNFLLPQGKATSATAENLEAFEARRAELEKQAADALAAAEARKAKLDGMEVTITVRAGNEGKLFGSVGPVDLAEHVTALGTELAKREIRMPHGAIRQAGEYDIAVHLLTDVDATLKLTVIGQEEE